MDSRRGEAQSAGKDIGRPQQNNTDSIARPVTRDRRVGMRDVDRKILARIFWRRSQRARGILNSSDDCLPERRGNVQEKAHPTDP